MGPSVDFGGYVTSTSFIEPSTSILFADPSKKFYFFASLMLLTVSFFLPDSELSLDRSPNLFFGRKAGHIRRSLSDGVICPRLELRNNLVAETFLLKDRANNLVRSVKDERLRDKLFYFILISIK